MKAKQGWTKEEDHKIVQLVQMTGQKWAVISALLPGRTDDAVRNRYLRLQRKRLGDDATATGGKARKVPLNSAPITSQELLECTCIATPPTRHHRQSPDLLYKHTSPRSSLVHVSPHDMTPPFLCPSIPSCGCQANR